MTRKRRRKPYRPRPVQIPHVLKVDAVLAPVEDVLRTIRTTGYVDAIGGDPCIIHRGQRMLFDMVQTLDTIARLHLTVLHRDAHGLIRLGRKLAVSMPLMESDLNGADADLVALRHALMALTPEQAQAAVMEVVNRDD